MEKKKAQSNLPQTYKASSPLLIDTNQRSSFGERFQSFTKSVLQPQAQEVVQLPEKLAKQRDKLMNKQLQLKDRLLVAMKLMNDCKFVNKQFEFKLHENKLKFEILNNMDGQMLRVIENFLFDVYTEHVEPFFQTENNFGYEGIFGSQPAAVQTECQTYFQFLVAIVYCKLIYEKVNFQQDFKKPFDQNQDTIPSAAQIQLAEQIKLFTYLMIKLSKELKENLKKEVTEVVLHFTEASLLDLAQNSEKLRISKVNGFTFDILAQYPEQKLLVETLFICYLAQCASFIENLDQEYYLNSVSKILNLCFPITEKFHSVFHQKIYDISSVDFLLGFVFKELLVDIYQNNYFSRTSLLNILLRITRVVCSKWKAKINKKSLNELNSRLLDQFETNIVKSMDKMQIRQIKTYQLTERFVKKEQTGVVVDKKEPFESIAEVEDSFVSEESEEISADMLERGQPRSNYELLKPDQPSVYQSQRVIQDPQIILNKSEVDTSYVPLLEDLNEQLNWIRVNMELMQLQNEILPSYFRKKEEKNELSNEQKMSSNASIIAHMSDLVRVQFYFLLRFNYQRPYKKSFNRQLIEIPDFIDQQDCYLIQTLVQFFSFSQYTGSNHDYRTVMLLQIYQTLEMISDGHYDLVDRLHYLKVEFLLFMNNKLENLIEPLAVIGNQINIVSQQFVLSLTRLLKIGFYSDKYLKLFEETFDIDNVQDIIMLQDLVREFEQKRGEESANNSNSVDDAIILVNKVLVQQQAIYQLIQTAEKSEIVCSCVLDFAINEINKHGMTNCNPKGGIYIEKSQHVNLPNGQSQISTLEYVLSNSGPFTSQLFICLKLVMGILNPQIKDNGKIYDVLHYSEAHYDKFHQSQSFSMSKNSFAAQRQSQLPNLPNSQISNNNQNFCDDCLRVNFQKFELNIQVKPIQLVSLFTILLQRIQVLSKSLEEQEQNQANLLGQDQLKKMTTMSVDQIRQHFAKIKQNLNQKVITKKTLTANLTSGYKIVEKVNGLMTRFLIFCSQNAQLGQSIITSITKTEQSESAKFPTQLEQLASFQINQYEPQNLRDIHNFEFKQLILRNVLFLIDPKKYDTVTYMLELLKDTLKQLYGEHKKYKEMSTDFQRLIQLLDPNHKPKNSQEVSNFYSRSRDRSASNIFFTDFESQLQRQKEYFKKLALIQISILSLYTRLVRENEQSLDIFERKVFLEQVLKIIQIYITAEGTYTKQLIEEGLNIFLFARKEPTDPFNIKNQTSMYENPLIQQAQINQLVPFYERILEFVLQTILDYINTVFNEDAEFPSSIESQTSVLQSIKFTIETLNNRIVIREGNTIKESITSELIKLQRSIRPDNIQLFKKIFIFLREQAAFQTVDVQYTIKQFTQLFIRLFGVLPKAIHLREFFSFLREIFYYNQQMDDVDLNLAEDVLKILNYSINLRHKTYSSQYTSGPRNEMIDHFVFSKVSPGLLILNNFEISNEPQICLLFRISQDAIKEESKLTKKKQIKMVIFSVQQKSAEGAGQIFQEKTGFNLEILVDLDKETFCLVEPQINTSIQQTNVNNTYQTRNRPLENRWHLLVMKFKQKNEGYFQKNDSIQLEVFIDKLELTNRLVYQLPKFDIKSRYLVALGNTVDFCQSQAETKAQNRFFRGRSSLPMFFSGLPDIKTQPDNTEIWKAIRENLTEFINSKEIINRKSLDLNPQLQKLEDRASHKQNKKYIIEFQTLDVYTQPVIFLHQTLYKQGYLSAAHCRRTSEVFVGLGGFKNMYPLIGKVIKSNLIELGRGKPGQVLSQIFKIMGSLMDQEPTHMQVHLQKRNLIPLLRYCILKIGKYQMITADLLTDIKNLVRKNILCQVSFDQQNERQYLIQNATAEIKSHKNFYSDFLNQFTHEILLDLSIATQTCQIISKVGQDISSTTHSSISGGQKTTIVFSEIIELIHSICCPQPLFNRYNINRTNKKARDHSKSSDNDKNQETISSQQDSSAIAGANSPLQIYSDSEILKEHIVSNRTTSLLMDLVQNSVIQQNLSASQLFMIGQCISRCILHQDDTADHFKYILNKTFNESKALSKTTLLTFLQIILQVVKDEDFKNKNALLKTYQTKDAFKVDQIAQLLYQFEMHPRDKITEEIKLQLDQIVATTLLILIQEYKNRRTQFGKTQLIDKTANSDKEKKQILQIITDALQLNVVIPTETYFTLMQIAFNKRNTSDQIPSLESVSGAIKDSRLRLENKGPFEIIDFDIDFYFVILDNFQRFKDQTKLLFLNQFMLFLQRQSDNFMKLMIGQQPTNDNRNHFLERLKLFYYQVVQLCIDQQDEALQINCQKVIVSVCTNLFVKSQDELDEPFMTQQDETNIAIFRRIFAYFGENYKIQLQVLQSILKQILVDVNWRKEGPYKQFEQVKLNMKLIQLLMYLEEVYVKNRSELSDNPIFHQTIMLAMFLFEQLGIVTLDMPDRISTELNSQDSNLNTSINSKKRQNEVGPEQKLQQLGLQVPNPTDKKYLKVPAGENSQLAYDDSLIRSGTTNQARSPTQSKRQLHLPQYSQQLPDTQQPLKATINFIGGGPVRIILHILLNSLYDARISSESFTTIIQLLRYLIFRDRTPFIKASILSILDENFETNSCLVYNLFNRATFLSDERVISLSKSGSSRAVQTKDFSLSTRGTILNKETIKDIYGLLQLELNIFAQTLEGIIQTTNHHHTQEMVADGRSQSSQVPSQLYLTVAENSKRNVKKASKCGFTMINGFLVAQLISESIEILNQIIKEDASSGEKSNDTADFDVKLGTNNSAQLAFVGEEDMTSAKYSQYEQDSLQNNNDYYLTSQQIQSAFTNQSKQVKINSLLQFLYDCMNEQLFSGHQTDQATIRQTLTEQNFGGLFDDIMINRIVKHLEDKRKIQSSEQKSFVNFMCSFLDNSNAEQNIYMIDAISESYNDTSSKHLSEANDSPDVMQKQKKQNAELFMNTMGFIDPKAIQANVKQQMLKQQQQSLKESDSTFKTAEKRNEEQKEQTKLMVNQIRLSELQSDYFEENDLKDPKLVKQETQKETQSKQSQNFYEDINEPKLKKTKSDKANLDQEDSQLLFQELPRSNINYTEQTLTESEVLSSENESSRESWVKTVEPDMNSPVKNIQKSNVRGEYKKQIYTYLMKLFLNLNLLVNADEVQKQVLTQKIIWQTLCKEKQRKIYISFAASTSNYFTPELLQVKVNSTGIFKKIDSEITRILDDIQKQQSLPFGDRRNAQMLDSKLGFNPLMQSQQIQRGQNLEPSVSYNQLSAQKQKEESMLSQSVAAFNPKNFQRQNNPQSLASVTQSLHLASMIDTSSVQFYSQQTTDVKNTIDYLYIRYVYRKTVKRLQEDVSSIWYDKVEEQIAEFKEIKEIYDQIQLKLEDHQLTAEIVWQQNREKLDLNNKSQEMLRFIDIWLRNIENQSLIKNPDARNHFVSQRRNVDSWGRMMLLKPNRKALDYPSWVFYDYFVFDFLNKAFAVSLLNDEDFPDLVRPLQSQRVLQKSVTQNDDIVIKEQKKVLSNPDLTKNNQRKNDSENDSDDSDFEGRNAMEQQIESEVTVTKTQQQNQVDTNAPIAYSVELQNVRNQILQRMERNKLLQRVLTDKQPLKRDLTEDPLLAARIAQKIKTLMQNEEQNRINNKLKFVFDAQNIRVKGTTWGTILITKDYFVYLSACIPIPEDKADEIKYIDTQKNLISRQELILKWDQIEEIMRKKVLNVNQGIDVMTVDKKCYSFNLCTIESCSVFMKNIEELKKELNFRLIDDPVKYFNQVEQYQNEWKNGQRTNMEFLLLINKFSGRSFNDLSQYPIFPWVLSDYDSNVYQFDQLVKNDACYRDFQKHTGIMGEAKKDQIDREYKTMKEEGVDFILDMQYGPEPFQMRYGFSTAMSTTQLLTRIEPFTTANYFNQDQKRDVRVPISFDISFNVNTMTEPQANLELLPEHFYFPEMLMNLNNLQLGWQDDKQTGKDYQIDQMFIPQWAINHHDFVRIMREALESKYVTENLGYWIDLIFGIYQNSDKKSNRFFCLAYEEWHRVEENRKKITAQQIRSIFDYYQAPSKLFEESLVTQTENNMIAATSIQIDTTEQKQNFNPNFKLIKAFLEYKQVNPSKQSSSQQKGNQSKNKLRLGQISVHNILEQNTNIVHMLFNNEKKCLVFVRQEDPNDKRQEVGNLVVHVCQETLSKESFKEKYYDLQLRYEWVAEELHNIMQVYSVTDSKIGYQSMKLFVCGYMDNSLRIFDLDQKPGQSVPKIIHDHNARITCMKFSSDFKFLYTCDEDGVILHYGRKKLTAKDQKDQFPYTQLYKLQDQTDEILAIDTNQTLDMYVTLSRDGTIAVRCQRSSKLWVHFKMFCKRQNNKKEEVIIQGFSKAFRHIDAIKLSLHGYIVLVGSSIAPKQNQSKYLVYNLNGDTLLAQMEEKCAIKNVFLNSTEDLMILAQNCNFQQEQRDKDGTPQVQQIQQGNIRVLKLYGLEKIANLTKLCYEESLLQIKQQKQLNKADQTADQLGAHGKQPIKTPIIGAIALKKGEASLNIFYVDPVKQSKEIICFETSKQTVWIQLEDMALAPRQRQDY